MRQTDSNGVDYREKPVAEKVEVLCVANNVYDDLNGRPADDVSTKDDSERFGKLNVGFDCSAFGRVEVFPLQEVISENK